MYEGRVTPWTATASGSPASRPPCRMRVGWHITGVCTQPEVGWSLARPDRAKATSTSPTRTLASSPGRPLARRSQAGPGAPLGRSGPRHRVGCHRPVAWNALARHGPRRGRRRAGECPRDLHPRPRRPRRRGDSCRTPVRRTRRRGRGRPLVRRPAGRRHRRSTGRASPPRRELGVLPGVPQVARPRRVYLGPRRGGLRRDTRGRHRAVPFAAQLRPHARLPRGVGAGRLPGRAGGFVEDEDGERALGPVWDGAAAALLDAAMALGAPSDAGEDAAVLTAAWRAVHERL